MRLHEIYSTIRPAVSVEFFAPKTEAGESHLAGRIPEIRSLNPAFCSVTYGAAGSSRDKTLWWVRRLKDEFQMEVMCHLTCVGQSRREIEDVLRELHDIGVENIIALRGDPPRGTAEWQPHPDGFHYAAELVEAAKRVGNFSVAVAGFPEVHPEAESREADLRYLKEKIDAGADAVITQLFFDNQDYFKYVDDARTMGINVPIVPGILPFRSVADVRRFSEVYARNKYGPARIPATLEERLSKTGEDNSAAAKLGIDYAVEQCTELIGKGAPGVHFYCMNESHAVEQILTRLRAESVLPHG